MNGNRPPHIRQNGRSCHNCGSGLSGRQQRWCSPWCSEYYALTHDWSGVARKWLFERERGVCAKCGLDTRILEELRDEAFGRTVSALTMLAATHRVAAGWCDWHSPLELAAWVEAAELAELRYASIRVVLQSLGFRLPHAPIRPQYRNEVPLRSLWEADHIRPRVEGGAGCDLSNYRTLCWPCHRVETAALAGRRAEARRPQYPLFGRAAGSRHQATSSLHGDRPVVVGR